MNPTRLSTAPAVRSLVAAEVAASSALAGPRHPHHTAAAWSGWVTAYIASTALGWPRRDCAQLIGRSKPLITHALRKIEDARDNPAFDAAMDDLSRKAEFL